MSNVTKHEDERRILYEWVENQNFKSAKVVIVKDEIPIGDHHHNKKTEVFFLLSGMFKELMLGESRDKYQKWFNVKAPYKVEVPKGYYHKFVCIKGSVLLGVASEPFDETDEIR